MVRGRETHAQQTASRDGYQDNTEAILGVSTSLCGCLNYGFLEHLQAGGVTIEYRWRTVICLKEALSHVGRYNFARGPSYSA